jgi:putative endopeptidase
MLFPASRLTFSGCRRQSVLYSSLFKQTFREVNVSSLNPLFLLLVISISSTALAQNSSAATPPVKQEDNLPQLDHFSLDQIDHTVDPCVDFYEYTCKKWIASNPIPADQSSWGPDGKLELWNQSVLRQVLEASAKNDLGRSAPEQKIGDYYSSCMDESAINAKGIAAIQPELDRIAGMTQKSQLAEELAHMHQITYLLAGGNNSGSKTAFFGFSSGQDLDDASKVVAQLDQGGLGLPDRDYYLKDDAKSIETRQQYLVHVQNTFKLLGENSTQAAADAKVVMEIETAMAKGSMDIVKRRDPANLDHKLSIAELRALTPAFSWDEYLKDVASPPTQHYLVATPDFFKTMNQMIADTPLDQWKAYLRWQLTDASSSLLSAPFVEERFDFHGRTLLGEKEIRPRWKRCVDDVDRDLGEALGQAYVDRAFGADGKARTLKLVHALEAAYGTDIEQLDWMTPATKKEAMLKLHKIEDKIGYPDHWRDYSSLKIVRGDALGNAYRSGDFELKRELAKIGKPVDREEWGMTPPTVNAYYDPQLNTINFPAGILQPPYFDKQMDDAVNYGETGATIGHEMTHGFDDEGRKFDLNGNLRDWWTAEDGKEFESRAKCISGEYSGFDAVPGLHLNGDLTLGENTADNGGTRIALMALLNTLASDGKSDEKIDGLTTEQRFFLAYGESWCSHWTPELLRLEAQSNPHAPPQYRVNGVVSNMPEFQKAFNCKKGQPMVRDQACHVW